MRPIYFRKLACGWVGESIKNFEQSENICERSLYWNWADSVFLIFSFGWGLKSIYNSDIFEKSRPPLDFQYSPLLGNLFTFLLVSTNSTILNLNWVKVSKCLKVEKFPIIEAEKAGLHKVKRCLQEFFDLLCACGKKHPSALSHATFSVRLCCFLAFLYLIHSYLSVHFQLMYHSSPQMTILAIVPGKPKMCL